jgi:hypothetical protein
MGSAAAAVAAAAAAAAGDESNDGDESDSDGDDDGKNKCCRGGSVVVVVVSSVGKYTDAAFAASDVIVIVDARYDALNMPKGGSLCALRMSRSFLSSQLRRRAYSSALCMLLKPPRAGFRVIHGSNC